jgi:hypothetical protein
VTPGKANVYPYFIGVFDTVAALGWTGAVIGLALAFVLMSAVLSVTISLLSGLSSVRYVMAALIPDVGERSIRCLRQSRARCGHWLFEQLREIRFSRARLWFLEESCDLSFGAA